MDLSIIIVNYNVRYFLQICLESLMAASQQMASEIIVIDNASSDNSTDMIRLYFPKVKLILNERNIGFGRACNQGLKLSQGRYVLFVNPDTIMGENLLVKALKIFERDNKIGAVGVCLLDGNGKVLRESKRSIPSLWSSFTKFSGLSDLFHRSSLFNQYYAPELNYTDSGEIEVLPGAFMLIRKDILQELDGFDPRFFMYAEDIDLSYRITRAGHRIWYDGSLHVVHFKGESTQKSLTSYTNTFFNSMKLFIRKYTGELYAPPVARLLQFIVGTIQRLQSLRRRLIPIRHAIVHHKAPDKLYLLTNKNGLQNKMEGHFGSHEVITIPEKGHGTRDVYLRYFPSWLISYPETSVMIDFRSFSFDQIMTLWKLNQKSTFFLADSENSFFIGSHNKEKQGEVHILDKWNC